MGFNPFSGRGLIALGTLGGSELLGENTMSKIPVLNSLGGYEPDSQKALIKKQEELAAEAKKRAQMNAQSRMNALGQSMLAFNPQNQMMAQMFGPDAAFSPQQFAQMAGDPGAMSQADYSSAREQSLKTGQPMGVNAADVQRMRENEQRQRTVQQQMKPLGPGPAQLKLPPPAAPRRY